MKFQLAAALFLVALPASAADYSGCIPRPVSSAYPSEYQLSPAGKLVNPGGAGVIKAESTSDADTLVLKMPEGVKGSQTFKLTRKNGRPASVSFNYPLFGGQNPQRATMTRNFRYEGEKCFLDEMTLVYSHGDDAKKTLVTYDHEMCDDLSEKFESAKKKMAACSEEFRNVTDILTKYDDRMRDQGKELFGFDRKKSAEDPFDVGLNTLMNCKMVRQTYPNKYKRQRGIHIPGFSFPGIFVQPADPGSTPVNDAR